MEKNEFRSNKKIYLIGIIYTIGLFSFGYSQSVFNQTFKPFINKYHPDIANNPGKLNIFEGVINGIFMFGGVFGNFSGGILINKFGGYKVELYRSLFIIMGLLLYLITNIYVLILTRFIVGFFCGLSNVTISVLIGDIIPKYHKIIVGSLIYFWVTLGGFNSYLWKIFLNDEVRKDYYFIIMLYPILIDFVRLILLKFYFKLESPFNLYFRNTEKSKKEIEHYFEVIYKDEFKETRLNEFYEDLKLLENKEEGSNFESVFSKSYRKQWIIATIIILVNQFTGSNVIIQYSSTVFNNFENEKYLTIMTSSFNVLSAITVILFKKRFATRFILLYGIFALSMGNLIYCFGSIFNIRFLQPIGIFIYMYHFGLSVGSMSYTYTATILPPSGVSLTLGIKRMSATIVSSLAKILLSLSKEGLFLSFSIFGLISFIYLFLNMIKVKGFSKGEIYSKFKNNERNSFFKLPLQKL